VLVTQHRPQDADRVQAGGDPYAKAIAFGISRV